MSRPADQRFPLGPFPLHGGRTLPEAHLDYRVHGQLNPGRTNVILYPSSFGGWPDDLDWLVGPVLDPERCTACGRCFAACPDAALPAGAAGTVDLLEAASRLATIHRVSTGSERSKPGGIS